MNTTGKLGQYSGPEVVLELDQRFFPQPWSLDQWQGINPDHHQIYTWEAKGKVLAFALFAIMPGDDTAHLYKILVHPDQRGSVVTREFWSSILSKLNELGISKIYLEVEATNDRAIAFYKKVGFISLRQVRAYYSNGSDGLMMQLTL